MQPAIALLEFDSIAIGIEAGDAMVKRAPLEATYAGTIQPGRYLVLVGGDTASVEEAVTAGRATGGESLIDMVLLPDVHPGVIEAVAGPRRESAGEAIGIIETASVAAIIDASDGALKGADVVMMELRLDGLGGKGYAVYSGAVAEVEAALDYGVGRLEEGQLIARRLIPQLHREMRDNLTSAPRFRSRTQDLGK